MDGKDLSLIIVGAGASRNLNNGGDPMPLMPDWMDDLVGRLERIHHRLPEVLGLARNESGQLFEEMLGRFLAWRRVLPQLEDLQLLGAKEFTDPAPFQGWYAPARAVGDEVESAVFGSLYELFGRDRVTGPAPAMAYGPLLALLRRTPATQFAFATTNYDVAIELALEEMSFSVATGVQEATWGNPPVVHPEGLIGRTSERVVPVLHLHGRIGWSQDEQRRVLDYGPTGAYDAGRGMPGMLLPDKNKNYSDQPILESM